MAARRTKAKKTPAKKSAAKKNAGRPSTLSQAIADKICLLIADGLSLRTISKKKGFPVNSTIYKWLDANKEFAEQYARARDRQADFYAAQVIELADKCRVGKKTRETKDGTFTETGDMVERSRLQIDARKWYAGKLAPKKYGDKVALVGGDGEKDEPICFTLRKIEGKKKE
jgi:hypothetical protein